MAKGKDTLASEPKRAKWTSGDNAALVLALRTQALTGNQSDNGFKSSAWAAAATAVNEVRTIGTPKTALGCKEHFGHLKKEYANYCFVVKTSGSGWSEQKRTITQDPAFWAGLAAKYHKWKNHTFPLYDEMSELVEGRIATGALALSISDLVNTNDNIQDALSSDHESAVDDSSEKEQVTQALQETDVSGPGEELDSCEASLEPNVVPPHTPARIPASTQSAASARKHAHDFELETSASKRRKGGRPSGPQSVLDMAGALRDVASSLNFNANMGPTTPQRRIAAVKAVSTDKNLDSFERSAFIRLIAKDVALADTYMAISQADIRSEVVRDELALQHLNKAQAGPSDHSWDRNK